MLPTAFTSQQRGRKRRRLARALARGLGLARVWLGSDLGPGWGLARVWSGSGWGVKSGVWLGSWLGSGWGQIWVLRGQIWGLARVWPGSAGFGPKVDFRRFSRFSGVRKKTTLCGKSGGPKFWGGGQNSGRGGYPPPGKFGVEMSISGDFSEVSRATARKSSLARFRLFFSLSRDLGFFFGPFGLDHGRAFSQKWLHKVVLGAL